MPHIRPAHNRFSLFAWFVLAYNIPVILWGAYVRVSFSGDGCGAHWPFCDGQVLPQAMARPMIVEFTHRMMTTLDLFLVGALVVWAFRSYVKGHVVRRMAVWSGVFLLLEALLGAGLVVFRMVAHDRSAGRAIYLSAHLTNTMLLLGALALIAWLAQTGNRQLRWNRIARPFTAALAITVVVSITGALAALGDTLFPASSLADGMRQDFSSTSSLLLRLRLFHPLVAISGAVYLLWSASQLVRRTHDGSARQAAIRVIVVVALQVVIGVANLSLLAPLWIQMIHLFMADALWIAVLLMVMESASVSLVDRTVLATA